jgi:spermidine/putrescine ABC transporter ATP-binding subunit
LPSDVASLIRATGVTAITIDGVARSFGAVRAVDDVSLAIRDGEFFTLLGPSGCGKTTLLRMVAGFCELDRGRILFGAERIDTLPPHKRNTGMVFQNYAVFPNLTVGDNVAYGLRARKVGRDEIARRVERALRLVQLDGYVARWPHQLSGGQLQRVAIARAVVIEPHVLLLDEPLSNLDAKLRVEMRGEIRALQRTLGITVIYVTHDQEEALAMSDRIGVMRAGRLEQVADPRTIYQEPATPFVASFVGTTNLLRGVVQKRDGGFADVQVGETILRTSTAEVRVAQQVVLSLRPEILRMLAPSDAAPAGWATLPGILGEVEYLGAVTRFIVRLADGTPLQLMSLAPPAALTEVRVAYDPSRVAVVKDVR